MVPIVFFVNFVTKNSITVLCFYLLLCTNLKLILTFTFDKIGILSISNTFR